MDPETGTLCWVPGRQCNYEPVRVDAGEEIRPDRPGMKFMLFRYGTVPERKWIEEYAYAPERNWLPILPGQEEVWHEAPVRLEESAYVRIVLEGPERYEYLEDCFAINRRTEPEEKEWIDAEADRLLERIREAKLPKGIFFLLLSDTHYAAGGIWKDSVRSMKAVMKALPAEGIIHLGDLTDGMYPKKITKQYASRVLEDMKNLGKPLFLCLGNHDANYFRGNKERFSPAESAEFYLGRKSPRYVQDFPEHRLRLIFLDSFDPERKERYGFSFAAMLWFWITVFLTKRSRRILVCSHVTPVKELHVWSKDILRGSRMMKILTRRKKQVLGWIHGHSHADQVFLDAEVPVVGIGCGKLEYFLEHKPEGSVTWPRRDGEASQELWDVLFIPDEGKEVRFFRYGAGNDRVIAPRRENPGTGKA